MAAPSYKHGEHAKTKDRSSWVMLLSKNDYCIHYQPSMVHLQCDVMTNMAHNFSYKNRKRMVQSPEFYVDR